MKRMTTAFAALLVSLSLSVAAHAAPFQNGDFEVGTNPGGTFITLPGGDNTSIPGWTVLGNSVDYIGGYWQPASGTRSLDLDGVGAGGIAQTFDVILGVQYAISFFYAGNPDSAVNKVLEFTIENGADTIITLLYPQILGTKPAMFYLPFTTVVVAAGTSMTISFESLTPGAFGPALDNVSVSAVPLPAALPLFGAALAALGLLARRRRGSSAS